LTFFYHDDSFYTDNELLNNKIISHGKNFLFFEKQIQYLSSYFVSLYKMILNLTSKIMKKIILLIVVFCGVYMSSLYAQNNYNFSYNPEVYRAGFDPVKIKQDKNIAKVSFVSTDKKGKVTVQEKTFDEAGRVLKHDKSDKKGILKTAFAYEYENDTAKNPGKVFVYSKSGELKTIVEYKMTKTGKISEYTTKYDDGNIIEKNLWFTTVKTKLSDLKSTQEAKN